MNSGPADRTAYRNSIKRGNRIPGKMVGIESLSPEERNELELRIRIEGIFILFSALNDTVGSHGTIQVLEPYVRMSAQAFCHNMQQMFAIEEEGFEKMATLTKLWETLAGNDENVHEIEHTKDRIIRTGYLDCPYKYGPS